MKKILLVVLIGLSTLTKAQLQQSYGLSDNGPQSGGQLFWQYSWDGGVNYYAQNIMEFDTNYVKFLAWKSINTSNNSNTRLLGIDGNGRSAPYDVSALPFRPLSYSPTLTIASGSISAGANNVALPDPSSTNEIQTLSVSGRSLTVSGANTVVIPSQTLSITGNSVSISSGNTITLPTATTPSLSLSTNTLSITGSNSVVLPTYNQTLSLSSNTLTINNGNSVTLPTYNQTLSVSGNSLSISNGNTITLPTSAATTYTNSGAISGGAGNVVFYLTSDKTSTGTALFTSEPLIIPIVNDASTNYTYGWTLSPDFKTLTVNVKSTPAINVTLLSLTLLGIPTNAANGTVVKLGAFK